MSNPYAPKKRPVAVEVPEVEEVQEAVILDVPAGSVNSVLDWVGNDADKARAAYAVETEDKKRVSLLSALKDLF